MCNGVCTHVAFESGKTYAALAELSAQVTSEVFQTHRELSLRFKETLLTAQATESEHQQFINSLQYETQNERRNQLIG